MLKYVQKIIMRRIRNLFFSSEDKRPEVQLLFSNLKKELLNLSELLLECNEHLWGEDLIYRFYHTSYKVFFLQNMTIKIVEQLKKLHPDRELNKLFNLIIREGTDKEFIKGEGQKRIEITRQILEGFFHARYFLEMAVKYGNELEYPPNLLPSGWAALLYLFNLR